MIEKIYARRSTSDDVYFVKMLIIQQNPEAIFLKGLDSALLGGYQNEYGKVVPVYSQHVLIELISKREGIGSCRILQQMGDMIDSYEKNENTPIIIDVMWDAEAELKTEGIEEIHEKLKNIKYEKLI